MTIRRVSRFSGASTTARRATRRTNDPGNHISGFIAAFRGVNTSTPINITSQSTGNSAAVSLATATTTVADTLVVMVGSSDDDADMFGPWANAGLSSVTDRYQASHALAARTISMATGIRATAGSYAASTSTLSVRRAGQA